MMAVNVYHACIVGIFTTRRLFVCGPRCAKNNSSCAAFRCATLANKCLRNSIVSFNILRLHFLTVAPECPVVDVEIFCCAPD